MNAPLTSAHYQTLLCDLAELMLQLQAVDPADFGRIARRPSEPADRLVEFLWHERDVFGAFPLPTLEDAGPQRDFALAPVAYLVHRWIAWVYDRNQFFDIDPDKTNTLRYVHRALMLSVHAWLRKATSFEEFAPRCKLYYVRYAERLARIFRLLTTPEGLRGRGAEYSAELQLKLLGLNAGVWREPIVDLGCGVDAQLVQHLRDRGLTATGIDRRDGSPFVLAADWFDVRFEARSLGTIISHLAFSLQFLHHHWHCGERAYAYARKYMEILRSLVQGGLFCYAPGLPFIESMLDPSSYHVTTLPLPEPLASTIGSLRDIGTGKSVAYACQIRRR